MVFTKCSQQSITFIKQALATTGVIASLFFAQFSSATTVQFQTVMGDFEVNLYDKTTPETVKNFLTYVNAGAYTNAIIHRSVAGFVVQGGGFTYTGTLPPTSIAQNAAVTNEPVYSNLRGTISMAKLGTSANSATNQWFFNLADNSANLDKQNGGFTVFGQVTGNGMGIVDAMAALNRFNMGSPFDSIPLRNYTATDATNNAPITDEQFVVILGVVVLDANPDTAANLNPTKNTLLNQKDSGSSSGGTQGWLLILLAMLALGRKSLLNKG